MKNIKYYIIFWLSRSPIFSVTNDKRFHEVSRPEDSQLSDLRFSLLSFGIGTLKLYLFTYKKGEPFKFMKLLYFRDIVVLPPDEVISEKVSNYHNHLTSKKATDIKNEIEFLKYKIEAEENRKSTAAAKINMYTTITLVLIPLMFSVGLKHVLGNNNAFVIITVTAIIYNTANLLIFIFTFYKVQSFSRSGFGDLKISQNHMTKLAESYYQDWYSIKSEATSFVSYVTNVERYTKYTIIFMILFMFLSNFNITKVPLIPHASNYQNSNWSFDIVFSENDEIEQSSLLKLNELQKKIIEGNLKQVIIVREGTDFNFLDKQYKLMVDSIKINNVNKIDIIEVEQPQDSSDNAKSRIKIIMIGGEGK
jgi:hypothetical protein